MTPAQKKELLKELLSLRIEWGLIASETNAMLFMKGKMSWKELLKQRNKMKDTLCSLMKEVK